jgi:hypothetical protein
MMAPLKLTDKQLELILQLLRRVPRYRRAEFMAGLAAEMCGHSPPPWQTALEAALRRTGTAGYQSREVSENA